MNFLASLKEFKNYLLKKENIFFCIFIIIIFFLDRYSKNLIINSFNEKIFYLNNYVNLELIWNTGIGFGIFSTTSGIIYNFITILIGVVILILLYIFFTLGKIDKIIYCLIIGGALGNFYDRFTYQAVPDFIDLHYNNFHWFTFNVADIFITLGILTFIFKSFFDKN